MKKSAILCGIVTLCMMLFAVTGFAQTTYTFSEYPGGTQYAMDEMHVLDNDVTVYTCDCHFTTQLRVYASTSHDGYFYTNALPLYIDSLAFNMGYNIDDVNIYGSTDGNTWTLVDAISVTNSSYANYGLSFGSNNYNYFKFDVVGNHQIRVVSMTIFYKSSGPSGNTAQTPTFTPVPGFYTSPVSVSIASATANASIYYTTDGTVPTTSSTLYTAPIPLSQTTTVKAIATAAGYTNSPAATATYTFPVTVSNIAAFKAQTSASTTQPFTIGNDVTYVFGQGSYIYVKDASAGLLIYGTTITTPYNEGDQISGLTGTRSVYSGQIEMSASQNTAASAMNTGSVAPVVVTISDLVANYDDYDAQLVTIEGVTFPEGFSGSTTTFTQGTGTLTLYNRFGIDTALAAGATVNITGFAAIYNGGIQIYPRYNQDITAPMLTPTLTITAPANGSTFSSLDTLPIGVSIENFTLGTDGYLKVESPLLTAIGLTNPVYLDQTGLNALMAATLSPLPAGTHTITCTLVDMNQTVLSPVISATTTFTVTMPELDAPVITVAGDVAPGDNTFYFNATVTMTAGNEAAIYYTTDGTTPTDASTLYTAPFQVTATTTVKAVAVKPYWQTSDVTTLDVTITAPTVATPVFTPGAGTYADSVTVALSCETAGAAIRYTTDGSEPTSASTLYSAPVTLTATTTVKAKAFKADWFDSETATALYTVVYEPVLTVNATALTFSSTQLTRTFTVGGAHLGNPITLTVDNTHFTVSPATITNPNSNTTVTVTFDGTEPATGTITVACDTMSATVALTATAQLPAPVLTPATAVDDSLITVTVSCTVADAVLHYTTDGSEPTAASAVYSTPIVFSTPGTYTVKAVAVKSGWENSAVVTGVYTVVEPSVGDTVIYTVGFEAEEGFAASNVYNNTTVAYTGPTDGQWGTFYGTPSTNNHLTGAQSMQMRWYPGSAQNIGYTFTNFDLRNVTHVTFTANSSNAMSVKVSHSIDGGSTYSAGETFTLGNSAQNFDYVVDENGTYDYVRLKFTVVVPETAPTATSRVIIDSVVVYGVPGVTPTTVSAPVITPNDGFYYEPQTVTITCSETGAVIRYTLDGSIPDETSTVYSAPFTVSSNTTVKAKAWKTGMTPSFVATATISFPAQVSNIAAFKANASGDAQRIMSDVTFVFRSGNYMFVQDNSAALMVYDNQSVITTQYNEGDVIQAGLYGSYQLYNGMVELIPSHNADAATGSPVAVTPMVATVADVKSQYASVYESRLVQLNDVEFLDAETFVQNGDTMSIRDRFSTVTLEINAGDVANVTGFVSYSTSYGYQIYPRDNNDIDIHPVVVLDTVATPEFDWFKDGEFYRISITCATDGASIYYTQDGTDPDESSLLYTGLFPLPLNVHYTLKAIAMKEGMANSAIAVHDYDPTGIQSHELRDNLSVWPNPAADRVFIGLEDGNATIAKVELFSIYGRLLQTVEVNSATAELSVGTLATGTYFAKVYTDNGVATVKVVRR